MLPRPGELGVSPTAEPEAIDKVKLHTELFDSTCELRVITNDILWQYYGGIENKTPNHITVGIAEAAYSRLLSWAANIPLNQVRGEQSSHGCIMMQ
jgi:hypothetical protein